LRPQPRGGRAHRLFALAPRPTRVAGLRWTTHVTWAPPATGLRGEAPTRPTTFSKCWSHTCSGARTHARTHARVLTGTRRYPGGARRALYRTQACPRAGRGQCFMWRTAAREI
jgi:hypothetical protein